MASSEKTNNVRRTSLSAASLDGNDRKLLGLLAEDSERTYAALGELLHLSAPAVHERVKRLKRDKIIARTAAMLDGA